MDKQFTQQIRAWLDTPPEERDIVAGATMLLQLDRNQILFNTITRRPEKEHDRLEYHLRKHLRIREHGHTLQDVVAMEERLMPAVKQTLEDDAPQVTETEDGDSVELEVHKGRSEYHHLFPDHIKAIYDRGGDLYEQMRKLYTMLLGMMEAAPCDRHELLVQLDRADKEYRQGWAQYDAFAEQFDPENPEASEVPSQEPPTEEPKSTIDPKAVNAARKFLSDGRKTLAKLEVGSEAHTQQLAAMQERVDTVIASGGTFKPEFGESLVGLGLVISE